MNALDPVGAHLSLLRWGRWDVADPPEIVHAVVPRDFSDDMALADMLSRPHPWHAIVNNLVMDADAKFGHRHWFDTMTHWREGIASGADGSGFYLYQRMGQSHDRIGTIWCYPDGTIISRTWIVGFHQSPPRKIFFIEDIADSLAGTMWFAAKLYEHVASGHRMECVVRSALASAQNFELRLEAGRQMFQVVQTGPAPFLVIPGDLEWRYPDEPLEACLPSIASANYCWQRLKPLYSGAPRSA